MDLQNRIKKIISDNLKINIDDINNLSGMGTLEGWDSIKSLSIIMSLEKEFSVKFDIDEFENLTNYLAIESAIRKLVI